jgi:hypothetical protein
MTTMSSKDEFFNKKQWVIILPHFFTNAFCIKINKLHPTKKYESHPFSMVWKVVQTYLFWSLGASKLTHYSTPPW